MERLYLSNNFGVITPLLHQATGIVPKMRMVYRYVAWNRHEAKPGVYNFTGENDVVAFVEMAAEEGLLVIVRPGESVLFYFILTIFCLDIYSKSRKKCSSRELTLFTQSINQTWKAIYLPTSV